MTLVLIAAIGDDADLVDANLAFHLNAGVDFVIAAADARAEDVIEVLGSYVKGGHARLASGSVTELGRLGVAEHGADWVFSCPSEEFWWPRGESLKDVLAVVPPRYGVVQALVRNFVGSTDEKGFFAEERIARSSLLEHRESPAQPLSQVLRPVYRATPAIEIEPDDWTLGGRRVPLRAWYPIEVLRFPTPPVAGNDALVDDPRLRDALRSLRAGTDRVGGPYALPVDGLSRFDFPIPNVVDDASYAIECAAVGEVDLVSLDRQIRELEARITELEAEFWPRFRSIVRRLARRRS